MTKVYLLWEDWNSPGNSMWDAGTSGSTFIMATLNRDWAHKKKGALKRANKENCYSNYRIQEVELEEPEKNPLRGFRMSGKFINPQGDSYTLWQKGTWQIAEFDRNPGVFDLINTQNNIFERFYLLSDATLFVEARGS